MKTIQNVDFPHSLCVRKILSLCLMSWIWKLLWFLQRINFPAPSVSGDMFSDTAGCRGYLLFHFVVCVWICWMPMCNVASQSKPVNLIQNYRMLDQVMSFFQIKQKHKTWPPFLYCCLDVTNSGFNSLSSFFKSWFLLWKLVVGYWVS